MKRRPGRPKKGKEKNIPRLDEGIYHSCAICGYSRQVESHHIHGRRVDLAATIDLCPNHHALITRGKASLTKLLVEEYYAYGRPEERISTGVYAEEAWQTT